MKIVSNHGHNYADNEVIQEKILLHDEEKDQQGKSKESPLFRTVEDWSSFFADILKYEQHDNEKNSRIE